MNLIETVSAAGSLSCRRERGARAVVLLIRNYGFGVTESHNHVASRNLEEFLFLLSTRRFHPQIRRIETLGVSSIESGPREHHAVVVRGQVDNTRSAKAKSGRLRPFLALLRLRADRHGRPARR